MNGWLMFLILDCRLDGSLILGSGPGVEDVDCMPLGSCIDDLELSGGGANPGTLLASLNELIEPLGPA